MLCSRATELGGTVLLDPFVARHMGRKTLTRVTDWDLAMHELRDHMMEGLLHYPSLRRVAVEAVDELTKDWSGQACRWEALTAQRLDSVAALPQLPSGLGRVVVTEHLSCREPGEESEAVLAQLSRWGPGRLALQLDGPPDEANIEDWHLEGVEREAGFFSLDVAEGLRGKGRLLQRTVLPPGGGPHTLKLELVECDVGGLVRRLAPLLAGTRVRTLCLELCHGGASGEGGVLAALPASVTCVRVAVEGEEQAMEMLSGAAARHPVALVLLFCGLSFEGERWLMETCAARQPLVRLEVKRR